MCNTSRLSKRWILQLLLTYYIPTRWSTCQVRPTRGRPPALVCICILLTTECAIHFACTPALGVLARSVARFVIHALPRANLAPICFQDKNQLPTPSLISSQATVLASKAADRVVHHPTPCADAMAKALSRGCGDLDA